MRPITIVGLGGSASAHSTSLSALQLALQAAERAGARTEIFDVHELRLPWYEHGMEAPEAAVRFAEATYAADGLLWSSPLYHGTVSGSFKNALDWLELLGERQPAYLSDKAVGLIATAGGGQSLQAINTMEYVVRALRGFTVPLVVPISGAWKVFDKDGNPRDPKVAAQLKLLGEEVVRAARSFRSARVLPVHERPTQAEGA